MNTPRRTNLSPQKGTIWIGKDHLPTIIFQGIFVSFQGGITYVVPGFHIWQKWDHRNQQFLTLARREDFGIARLVVLVPLLKIQVSTGVRETRLLQRFQTTCKRRGKTGLGRGDVFCGSFDTRWCHVFIWFNRMLFFLKVTCKASFGNLRFPKRNAHSSRPKRYFCSGDTFFSHEKSSRIYIYISNCLLILLFCCCSLTK